MSDFTITVDGADRKDNVHGRWLGPEEEALAVKIVLEESGKWFVCDPRSYDNEPEDYIWYCIHGGSVSWDNVMRDVQWQERSARWPRGYDLFIVEARNKTQVKEYLRSLGYNTESYNPHRKTDSMNTHITAAERRIEAARRRVEREQERLDFLLSLPSEPEPDPDGACMIWFTKRFVPNGTKYTYGAVKTDKGWYTTGPSTPKAYSWDDLIAWIMEDSGAEIWVAASYEPLG